jgi:hypothetical protein
MEHNLIHKYGDNHQLIKLSIKQLLELPIENWKHNRPPDEIRVSEIETFIQKRDTLILQPFYIHYNPKNGIYEILDGIHRYTAMKNIEYPELIEDKIVFVHLFVNLTYGNLIDIFQDINKTVPVPELYINSTNVNDNANEKVIIEEVSKEWQRKYKSHFSPSSNYNVPNINRDVFINILSHLYTSYKVRNSTKMSEMLERANTNIRDYVLAGVGFRNMPIKFSDKQKEKCKESGCYLFLYKDIETIKYFAGKL